MNFNMYGNPYVKNIFRKIFYEIYWKKIDIFFMKLIVLYLLQYYYLCISFAVFKISINLIIKNDMENHLKTIKKNVSYSYRLRNIFYAIYLRWKVYAIYNHFPRQENVLFLLAILYLCIINKSLYSADFIFWEVQISVLCIKVT